MPLFNDRRNSSPAADIADPRDPSAALPQNKNKRDVMNYTTPKGYIGGANMYGTTYPKTTDRDARYGRGNGSKYSNDMIATNKAYRGKDDSIIGPAQKAKMAYQKSYINRGAAASQKMNQSKKWEDNPLVKKYDSGK